MNEVLAGAALYVAMQFSIIIFTSWLLHYFVALRSPPTKRAAWIAGISYLVASAIWLLGGPEDYKWESPFAALPGALIVFWWWRVDFRRDWIDDAQGSTDGVELANTDWRVGILGVLGLIVAGAIKVFFLHGAGSR